MSMRSILIMGFLCYLAAAVPVLQATELLGNGDFENDWGDHTQLGTDLTLPAEVDSDITSDWETIAVGDWIRAVLGNWCEPPAGTGNDSDYVAALRKGSGHFQSSELYAASSGDVLKLNWDYHVPTGMTTGPTFTFRIFGVNEAGTGETATEFNDVSTTVNNTTTVSGESYNYEEIGNVSLAVSASDPDNDTWQSASEASFNVDDDWDYIVLLLGRNAGDNNNAYVQVDNVSLDCVPGNIAPVANAGADQLVTDSDRSGSESVTLVGTASTDSDGTIVSYIWTENSSQIATGSSPTVNLSAGTHTITLIVTDDDDATDTDTVVVEVNTPPVAAAGADQNVTDEDDDGYESITLSGSSSTDSDGSISSYVWTENSSQIATGASPSVSFAVGTHNVTLTVTDDDGATDSDSVVITIEEPASTSPAVLNFTQSGTDLIITAERSDESEQFWQLVIDETRGVISEFYDLKSTAGTSFNYACPYSVGAGLFVPYDSDIRRGYYTYTAGSKTDGQSSFSYTLYYDAGTYENTSTVTLNAPDEDGTLFAAQTSAYYNTAASVAQTASPGLWMNAATETQMNNIYSSTRQDDISLDGSLWLQVEIADSADTSTLGLSAGRTFLLKSDDLFDGNIGLDGAWGLIWHTTFRAFGGIGGGIYDNYASKPPADSTCVTSATLEIDIAAATANEAPTANAGADQSVTDTDNSGAESVTLNGSSSSDSDGSIVSYIWTENSTQIATGATPSVNLSVGTHSITLTVTDDDSASDTDTVVVTVNAGSTGSMLYPGSNWDGSAGSGYSTAPTESTTQIGTGTAKAIALWDVVPRQIITEDFEIGVIAFHHEGIDSVEFMCEGNTVTVTDMAYNPRTGVDEYYATLDVSQFDNGTNSDGRITVYARVIPESGYERLLSFDMFCNEDGTLFNGEVGTIIYLCGTNGDDSRTAAQAQNPSTPVATFKKAADLAGDIATQGTYGGNGVIIEVLSAGFYNLNRPLSNYGESWMIFRPTAGLDREDVVVGANGTEIEWPSLNLKNSYIKFENITFDISYWMSMSGHWADGCLYTDPYGSWHGGGSASWQASTRTLTRQYFFAGYDHTARAAAGENYLWIRGGDASITPGFYEIESKISDDAIVLSTQISSNDIQGSVQFGRGHDFLRTNATAYATNCDFWDTGSGPGKYKIVRGCDGYLQTGDFMQEWNLVVNTTIHDFHGAWTGFSGLDFHSDVFQRVAATDNSILYNVKAYDIDAATQMLFFENSTSTMGGNGQHDNWALVSCLFERDAVVTELPLTQFTRTCDHVMLLNNTFIGQTVTFRVAGEETFDPYNSLISQNIFHKLNFSDTYLTDAIIDDNHYITGSIPSADSNYTSGSTLTTLFNDPANDDYTPISSTLTDRATPLVPVDIDGNTRSNPTAIGAFEE